MLPREDLFIKYVTLDIPDETDLTKYPYTLPVIRNLQAIAFRKPVTFLVAENGLGKSTLLEAIAVKYGFNPEGGSRNFHFSTYNSHAELHENVRITKSRYRPEDGFFFRAESFYNVATEIENIKDGILKYYGGKSLHEQSHGESFMAVVNNRLYGNGIYIFDEPEAALSPLRQMALLVRIKELVEQNSQFIIATHSPIIMGYPDADIYQIDNDGQLVLTDYRQTEHFSVMSLFINNRENMLKELGILWLQIAVE